MTNVMFYEFVSTECVEADSPFAAPADAKFPFNTNTVAIMETDKGVQFPVRPEQLEKIALAVRPQLTLENFVTPSSRDQLVAVDHSVNHALSAIFRSDTLIEPTDTNVITISERTSRIAAWSKVIYAIEDSGLSPSPKVF